MVIKCPHCNHYISDTVTICPHCGNELKSLPSESKESNQSGSTIVNDDNANIQTLYEERDNSFEDVDDSAGFLMKILCFLIPIVGFVLYFVKRKSLPNAAKDYLIWAAAGFVLAVLSDLVL